GGGGRGGGVLGWAGGSGGEGFVRHPCVHVPLRHPGIIATPPWNPASRTRFSTAFLASSLGISRRASLLLSRRLTFLWSTTRACTRCGWVLSSPSSSPMPVSFFFTTFFFTAFFLFMAPPFFGLLRTGNSGLQQSSSASPYVSNRRRLECPHGLNPRRLRKVENFGSAFRDLKA